MNQDISSESFENEVIEENGIKLYRRKPDNEYNKYDEYKLDNEKIEAKNGNTLVYVSYGDSWYRPEDFEESFGLMDRHEFIKEGKKFEKPADSKVYMVYSAELSADTNMRLLVSNLNVDSNFIRENIEDIAKCLGGLEGLKKLIEELYIREEKFDESIAMTLEECLDEIEKRYKLVEDKKDSTQDVVNLADKKIEMRNKKQKAKNLANQYEEQAKDSKEGQTMGDAE